MSWLAPVWVSCSRLTGYTQHSNEHAPPDQREYAYGQGLSLTPLVDRNPGLRANFMNTLPVQAVETRDITNAVLFLASDESRYVAGLEFATAAGTTIR